jgi:CubicO group peptidase (beta-lactamase class C family)
MMNALIHEIQQIAETSAFTGVVSIFNSEVEVFNQAFYYADIANRRENNTETKFAIASGTKLFTALGIGVLIDRGHLKLDTTAHDIFGGESGWVEPGATIHHLLTHTSGVYDYYDEELISDFDNFFVEIPWYRLETPADYLPLFEAKRPKFAPGERFSYSNGGYICLGIIIEKISGGTYREFIQENIFDPARMLDSGFFAFNQLPENTAYGYKETKNGEYETNFYNLPIRGASDGGAYTTTLDLRNLWEALFDHRILSEELTTQFLSPQVNVHDGLDYGYGVYIARVNGITEYSIEGGDAGVGFYSGYLPDKDLLINILSNTTNGEEEIRKMIYDRLTQIIQNQTLN